MKPSFEVNNGLRFIRQYGRRSLAVLASVLAFPAFGAVKVESLEELLPYLDDDGVEVVMAPGTYRISTKDIKKKRFGVLDFEERAYVLLPFEGNGSTYDFTGVTLEVETGVFKMFGNKRVHELVVTGNENELKNLTMVDVGSVYDRPNKGALNVCIDGRDNRIEGFHISSKGSYPYGYGDAFGKGGNSTIPHAKHSSLLVRGLRNHVKDCTIIHRTYGHAIFMQAASYPTIEGCYVEGEVRKTDDMLAETSGPAYDIDFMTVWGYRLPPGYMMSLGEAGIRAYDGGTTMVDGEIIKRGTDNPTILNCTVKFMRTGVTIAHATGKKYVEGCVAIACENGFSLGTGGEVVNCSADCAYGPVYASTYERDKRYNADITILPAAVPYYNGSKSVAYIGGSGHYITLRGAAEALEEGYGIKVGGDKNNIRLLHGNLPNQNDFKAFDFELDNQTDYPVVLSEKSSGVTVRSKGEVRDQGTGNRVLRN
ncbi:right-handed parallel beta-helix repeat-containing protein [Pelagicoccus enzymogenes]|uniref:right-handed parallel beta-helix repeat-containing protein n=1 Tax=Pelagicoccus enzymogenes TaxID=2773457 RepID=UPI00280F75A6|nr:right-handed parallel beta-helix repeat-containing protein [Pelagicoccus enzymogenes]MDQ8197895.1 right-handed parallel beta-helix repeat-containing protein [Pelagicoccus enzymogenes]